MSATSYYEQPDEGSGTHMSYDGMQSDVGGGLPVLNHGAAENGTEWV